MSSLLLVAIILGANLLLSALFIWRGIRFVRAPSPSFSRALVAAVAIGVVGVLLFALTTALHGAAIVESPADRLIVQATALIVTALISCVILRSIFRTTFPRALAVWCFQLVAGVIALAFTSVIVQPFILEAIVVPTNSMAPTVVGWHTSGICPHCQGILILPVPLSESGELLPFGRETLGICASCWKTSTTQAARQSIRAPDRVLVNKLLNARPWDMVVCQEPFAHTRRYVRRVVGFPGETVFIKEGSIWVNGVRLEPPANLAGLHYTTEIDGGAPVKFGTTEEPLCLEADQYGVLGDFSQNAADSRFWGPVRAANIEGVVTVCYWPFSRWRVFH